MSFTPPGRPSHPAAWPLTFILGLSVAVAACDDPVRSVPLGSLQIDSVFPFMDLEQELELTVTARDLDGDEVRGNRIVWETRDSALVQIRNGVVTAGVEPGVATILASSGGLTDSIRITIERPVTSLYSALSELVVAVGRETQLKVTARTGWPDAPSHSIRFSVADPAIVTVSDSGMVSPHAKGSTTITVTAGHKSVVIPVTVAASYALTVLGTLGGEQSLANDINESGQVVGTAQTADGTWHAFLWEDGAMRDLGSGGLDRNSAYAINDHGMIVGTAGEQKDGCTGDGCETQPWVWSDGEMRPISIEGVTLGRFTDVNNHGQVTGYTSSGWYRFLYGDAFIWDDGVVTWLGKYGTAETGEAQLARPMAINDDGVVAATMFYYALAPGGVIWRNGEFTPLVPYVRNSVATAVNDAGVVAGNVNGRLVTWRDGELTWLSRGGPRDIDNAGRIVGSLDGSGFLWDGVSLIDLSNVLPPDVDYSILEATAMNEAGQIVGHGLRDGSVFSTAFLLTPAP